MKTLWIEVPYQDADLNNMVHGALVDAVDERVISRIKFEDGSYVYRCNLNGNSNTCRIMLYKFMSQLHRYINTRDLPFSMSHVEHRLFDIDTYPTNNQRNVYSNQIMRIESSRNLIKHIRYGWMMNEDQDDKYISDSGVELGGKFKVKLSVVTSNGIFANDPAKNFNIHIPKCGAITQIIEEKRTLGCRDAEFELESDVVYSKDVSINDIITIICSIAEIYSGGRLINGAYINEGLVYLLFNQLQSEYTGNWIKNNFIDFYKGRIDGYGRTYCAKINGTLDTPSIEKISLTIENA